jgi:hypothetical protein
VRAKPASGEPSNKHPDGSVAAVAVRVFHTARKRDRVMASGSAAAVSAIHAFIFGACMCFERVRHCCSAQWYRPHTGMLPAIPFAREYIIGQVLSDAFEQFALEHLSTVYLIQHNGNIFKSGQRRCHVSIIASRLFIAQERYFASNNNSVFGRQNVYRRFTGLKKESIILGEQMFSE